MTVSSGSLSCVLIPDAQLYPSVLAFDTPRIEPFERMVLDLVTVEVRDPSGGESLI